MTHRKLIRTWLVGGVATASVALLALGRHRHHKLPLRGVNRVQHEFLEGQRAGSFMSSAFKNQSPRGARRRTEGEALSSAPSPESFADENDRRYS